MLSQRCFDVVYAKIIKVYLALRPPLHVVPPLSFLQVGFEQLIEVTNEVLILSLFFLFGSLLLEDVVLGFCFHVLWPMEELLRFSLMGFWFCPGLRVKEQLLVFLAVCEFLG